MSDPSPWPTGELLHNGPRPDISNQVLTGTRSPNSGGRKVEWVSSVA